MIDEKLDELEAVCGVKADEDGKVRFYPRDVLELVNELRDMRKHAADRSALGVAIADMRRILTDLSAYLERQPSAGVKVSSRIAVQDPGR
jgi:hypothetical protein